MRCISREHEFSFVEGAVHGGPKATQMRTQQGAKFHRVLSSYELIVIDQAILNSVDWPVLVVDGTHRLRNDQSKVCAAAAAMGLRLLKHRYRLIAFSSSKRSDSSGSHTNCC